ncbi:MAG: biopolymer transporter ExbD [Minicystis sp.]
MSRVRIQHIAVLGLALAGCKSDTPVLRAACEAGSADACSIVAARLMAGTEGKPDEEEATKFWKREVELRSKACAAGEKVECTRMIARGIVMSPLPLDAPKLPSASDVQLTLAVELHADGTTLAGGKPMADDAALLDAAHKLRTENPDARAVIRADTTVQHGRVIRVLDILKQAGITKIAFGVSTPAADAGAAP